MVTGMNPVDPVERLNQRLVAMVEMIEANNATVAEVNERSTGLLRALSGENFGTDVVAWLTWWADRLGFDFDPPKPPDQDEAGEVPYKRRPPLQPPRTKPFRRPQPPPVEKPVYTDYLTGHTSCFGAGTPVRTVDGLKPIDEVEVGDRVLTQDADSGRLSFEAVLDVYHNRPSPTLRIDLGPEALVVTGIHRLWKAGHGWVMARELKPGDRLRTAEGGLATVGGVSEETVQRVFNLEVVRGQSFFVGRSGVLAHDNTLAYPVARPFDAPAGPRSIAGRSD